MVALGASGLLLGPVFASTTHGYDTVDHLRIDPRLGDDSDFDDLVAEAHGRGVKVLLDGVFNHVGRDSAIARRSVDAIEGRSDDEVWLLRDADGAFVGFEGHGALVTLDHARPSVVDYVVRVMNHWLDRGADGWRLDAAYAVPTTFWAQVLPRVRAEHPDAWFVAEVIHGDYPAFVQESAVDSVTQYELWKAIWSSLYDRNLWELAWSLTGTTSCSSRSRPRRSSATTTPPGSPARSRTRATGRTRSWCSARSAGPRRSTRATSWGSPA